MFQRSFSAIKAYTVNNIPILNDVAFRCNIALKKQFQTLVY